MMPSESVAKKRRSVQGVDSRSKDVKKSSVKESRSSNNVVKTKSAKTQSAKLAQRTELKTAKRPPSVNSIGSKAIEAIKGNFIIGKLLPLVAMGIGVNFAAYVGVMIFLNDRVASNSLNLLDLLEHTERNFSLMQQRSRLI